MNWTNRALLTIGLIIVVTAVPFGCGRSDHGPVAGSAPSAGKEHEALISLGAFFIIIGLTGLVLVSVPVLLKDKLPDWVREIAREVGVALLVAVAVGGIFEYYLRRESKREHEHLLRDLERKHHEQGEEIQKNVFRRVF